MPHSQAFSSNNGPLDSESSLSTIEGQTHGAVRCLNPTQARFQCTPASGPRQPNNSSRAANSIFENKQPVTTIQYVWTSRNSRKGRHGIIVSKPNSEHDHTVPQSTAHWHAIRHILWLMLTYYPFWDISWCVAVAFTWGSALWVLNGLFIFLPFVQPLSTFPNQVLVGGGVSAFIGATVFEVGSILLFLEAVNENRVGCFGWAVEQVWIEHFEHGRRVYSWKVSPNLNACGHHHRNKQAYLTSPILQSVDEWVGMGGRKWSWLPSWYEVKTHYARDLGFIASTIQLIGTTIFWVAGVTALPGLINVLSTNTLYVVYWFPLILGGAFFVLSGFLFMIETQKHWWLPAPRTLGWHVGLLSFIGGIGFLLSPCFGLIPSHWAQYQAACISTWASACFLLGSTIQ